MSNLSTNPASFQMASTETLPLRFDCTNLLSGAEVPSAVTVTLTDLRERTLYPDGLSGSPSVSTVYITQTVTDLVPGRSYRLAISFTAAAGKIWTMELLVEVPF